MSDRESTSIGLTGGMGCGKSTVLAFFREEGFGTISSDEIVRELLAEDQEVIGRIASLFGSGVLSGEGSGVNRRALGKIVFRDPEALRALEGLLHPLVRKRWQEEVNLGKYPCYVVEIPLLFEKNLEKHFKFSVCVSAAHDVQLQRLAEKGISREDAEARMAQQLPLNDKIEKADFVISNNGSLQHLRAEVSNLVLHLCSQTVPVR